MGHPGSFYLCRRESHPNVAQNATLGWATQFIRGRQRNRFCLPELNLHKYS